MDRDEPLTHFELILPAGTSEPDDRPARRPLPAGIELRTADPARDLPAIAELYNAVFGRQGTDAVTPERVARIARHPGIRPEGVLLAFAGDLPVALGVGRIAARGQGDAEPGGTGRRGAIELLAVRPGHGGQGLAHALLHFLLAWLASEGITRVEASAASPVAAHLLAQHGFRADREPER